MAQPAASAKIEELRFKVKTDPKSRLFYPLAEELRKAGQVAEAEQVLRTGLTIHPTYLSAWVSLGRVLREQKNDGAAVEALNKALQLDPGNVVAARLLADAYLSLGDKVEAIKKYKLVHALLPADEELKEQIEALDRELHPPAAEPAAPPPLVLAPAPPPAPVAPEPEDEPSSELAANADSAAIVEDETLPPFAEDTAVQEPLPTMDSPFDDALAAAGEEARMEQQTGDAEPMSAAHEESPFEEPSSHYGVAAMTLEGPAGFHLGSAPLEAEVAAPLVPAGEDALPSVEAPLSAPEPPAEEADVFAPDEPATHPPDDLASTITMADLYVRQGLKEDARQIYQSILMRDPGNAAVSEKLAQLDAPAAPTPGDARVRKLESWLAKVTRNEVGRV